MEENTMPQGPFCQSCGMPLQKADDFGTEADGTKSEKFCIYCYENGKFTDPDITMEAMINLVSGFLAEAQKTTEEEAKAQVASYLPKLERWNKA